MGTRRQSQVRGLRSPTIRRLAGDGGRDLRKKFLPVIVEQCCVDSGNRPQFKEGSAEK